MSTVSKLPFRCPSARESSRAASPITIADITKKFQNLFIPFFMAQTQRKHLEIKVYKYTPFYQWTIGSISSSFLMQVFSRRDVPECSLETVSLWRLSAWPEQRFPWHTCTATHKMKLDSLKTYRLPRGNLIIISKFIRTTQLNFSLLTRVKKGCSHCRINY